MGNKINKYNTYAIVDENGKEYANTRLKATINKLLPVISAKNTQSRLSIVKTAKNTPKPQEDQPKC